MPDSHKCIVRPYASPAPSPSSKPPVVGKYPLRTGVPPGGVGSLGAPYTPGVDGALGAQLDSQVSWTQTLCRGSKDRRIQVPARQVEFCSTRQADVWVAAPDQVQKPPAKKSGPTCFKAWLASQPRTTCLPFGTKPSLQAVDNYKFKPVDNYKFKEICPQQQLYKLPQGLNGTKASWASMTAASAVTISSGGRALAANSAAGDDPLAVAGRMVAETKHRSPFGDTVSILGQQDLRLRQSYSESTLSAHIYRKGGKPNFVDGQVVPLFLLGLR